MNLKWDTDDKVVLQIIKAFKSVKQGWCIIFSIKGQMVSIFEFVSFRNSFATVQLFVIAPKQLYTVNKGLNVRVCESCSVLSDSLQPHGLYSSRNSPDQYTGVGSLFLLQGIFPTQELNPGLPHCRQILYQLGHKGSPRILEWVAYPFSSGSSHPRNLLYCRWILCQLSYQGSLFLM